MKTIKCSKCFINIAKLITKHTKLSFSHKSIANWIFSRSFVSFFNPHTVIYNFIYMIIFLHKYLFIDNIWWDDKKECRHFSRTNNVFTFFLACFLTIHCQLINDFSSSSFLCVVTLKINFLIYHRRILQPQTTRYGKFLWKISRCNNWCESRRCIGLRFL